jgi:hypothetical protein
MGLGIVAMSVAAMVARLSRGQLPPPIVLDEFKPRPVALEDMIGEWSGLGVKDENLLVTLRVGDASGRTLRTEQEDNVSMTLRPPPMLQGRLAIAQESGSAVAVDVLELTDWRVQNGAFSASSKDGQVTLRGEATASWRRCSWAHGILDWKDAERRPRQSEIYLFHAYRGSWMERTLNRARRYGLL